MKATPHPLRLMARTIRQRLFPIPFLARRYIHSVCARYRNASAAERVYLDVGAGVAPYRHDILKVFGPGLYIAMDIAPSDAASLVADATQLPLADASVDLALSMDTVQHIPCASRALDELARVVKPGGILILSFPFAYGECDVVDFYRWSIAGMTQELRARGFEIRDSRRRGGPFFAAMCAIQWVIQHAVPGSRQSWRQQADPLTLLRATIVQLLSLPVVALAWCALAIDRFIPSSGIYMGGLIVATRANEGIS